MRKAAPHDVTRRAFLHTAAVGMAAGCSQSNPAASPRGVTGRYPFYRAAGDHRKLGRQHGAQAAEHIHAHLAYIMRTLRLSRRQLRERALRFTPLFTTHCPHLLEELDGLAEGAGISRADALAVNIRGALTRVGDEGCTTYVIGSRGTADGEILIGQNADTFAEIIDFAYVLHLEPTGKPEVLIWTFGGMIGYHGINSAGVGQFAADLGTGGPQPRFGLPHYPVKRMMLECTRLDEISALLGQVPLGANGSYVLCDGRRKILNIEATTAGPVTVGDDGAGFIAHSNHFVGDRYATPANHQRCMPDSFTRLERMNGLLRDRYGEITVGDVQRFLGDRENDPTAICRRRTDEVGQGIETAGQTVASIIAEPARRRMHVALGNAADRVFVSYGMDS